MSKNELKELSELLNKFRNTVDIDIFYNATDFEILKAFTECAIMNTKKRD